MKKLLALTLALLMILGTFASCGGKSSDKDDPDDEYEENEEENEEKETVIGENSESNAENDGGNTENGGNAENDGGNTENGGNTEDGGNTENSGNENEEPEEEPLVESTAGLEFELNADGKGYTLVGKGTCTATEIVIDGYNGLPVTSIGDRAFEDCSSLASVTIGNSVTGIGYNAFYNTAYYKNESNWENGVLYIGKYLIDAKIDILGVYDVKDGTKLIADSAFFSSSSLTSVAIPNSVTSIGDDAFHGCTSLTSVTIPNSVTSIGNGAFYSCDSLTSVTIGNGVTSIGDRVFYDCSSLTSITVDESNTAYKSIDGNLYSKDGKTLIQYARGKTDTSFAIPDSVTSIGDDAFYSCDSLTSVTIGNSVTSIGDYVFYGCSSLTSVTIGNNVTSIGDYVFACCYSLTSVTIGKNVTSIGNSAFYGCSSLTSIKYRGTQEQWGNISKGGAHIPYSCVITYNYTGE